MNILRLTLWAEVPLALPMAHNQMIQGALYQAWKEALPGIHDEGFSSGEGVFRMFTFGPLQGRYDIVDKRILFRGAVSLEIRSPVPAMIEELAAFYEETRVLRFGYQTLPLVNIEAAERRLFPASAIIRMRAPVTIHSTLADGHTQYYAPTESAFPLLLAGNLASKVTAAGLNLDPVLGILPFERTLRKRVTTFKGSYITGYLGTFRLEAAPETMAFLYYTGLGDRSSQGFGMFDIIEGRPLA